jgi:serine/threonine protein kinase
MSVEHRVHVDHDYNWTNVNPDEAFVKLAKLGEGSYGAVWQVRHRDVGTEFAAKVIPLAKGDANNLAKEIKVLRACRSPHIVSYYGTIVAHEKSIWVLMDYASLGSLRDAMELCGRALTEPEISAVMAGALEGLAYLHERGIMHLDIKAANILMSGDLKVKLADFGVSEQVHILGSNSGMQTLIGTPFWIAPEIVLKRPHSSKADIWSLGITAIELAERNPPGFKLNPFRYMSVVPNRPPPELSEPAKWSGDFIEFVARCLCIDPARRLACTELL